MKVSNKRTFFALFLAGCVLAGYFLWLSLRPVEIVAVHDNGDHSYVLVKTFPFTDKGKINWWLKNKDRLKSRYDIPRPASDGNYTVIFWDFGDGYTETDGYDRLCFTDMQPPINCIEKDAQLYVGYTTERGEYFILESGEYDINNSGKIRKRK